MGIFVYNRYLLTMKYIITESKFNHLIKKYISNKFKKLIVKTTENHIFFVDNTNKIILELVKSDLLFVDSRNLLFVDSRSWNNISDMFSLDYDETQRGIKEWAEESLKLESVTPIICGADKATGWKLVNLR